MATAETAEIEKGTGEFVKPPRAKAVYSDDGDITLNFADANIREVVRTILGDIMGRNYVIDPAVQGTITIQTSRPLEEEELLPTLENLLKLTGAALIAQGADFKVVPLANAPRETREVGIGTRLGGPGRGWGVQIVPLEHVSAAEMRKVLEPVASDGNILNVDSRRNLLMLGGSEAELENLLELIYMFDVDWLEGMSFGYFPLKYAEATTLIDELRQIVVQDEAREGGGLLRFVPIERLNALIAISPRASQIERVGDWIDRLDRGGDQESSRLFVYYVQNKRAVDLAETLSRIFVDSGTARSRAEPSIRPGQLPVELTSSETLRDAASTRRNQAGANETGTAERRGGSGENGTNQGQSGARNARRAAATSSEAQVFTIAEGREIRIIADDSNNALIVLATPADYRMVESTLKKLDLVPLQVLIEATIAEVRLTDDLRYGLQWFFSEGKHSATLSSVAAALPGQVFPGFSYLFAGNNLRVVLNALDDISDVKVISSPTLMVLDNQTASLQVGDTVPILTEQSTTDTGTQFNSVQQQDTSVILTVTPRVNAGGLVILEILQEVSEAVGVVAGGINSPIISRRKIETTIAVQSGETVALGGLIRDSKTRSKSGLPLLHQLPIIGSLFGETFDSKDRTELLIVLTPRVVRSAQQARDVTRELRRRLRSVSPLDARIGLRTK